MTPKNDVTVTIPHRQAQALLAAANRQLTDDPRAIGPMHKASLTAAAERLAESMRKRQSA